MARTGLLSRIVEGELDVSPARRMAISLVAVALLLLACLPYFNNPVSRDAPVASQGQISFVNWKDRSRPVLLKGGWSFSWDSPLGNAPAGSLPPVTMTVPKVWNGIVAPNGERFPYRGNATYRLTLKDLPPGRYRIAVPTIFAASEIRLDGRLVSGRGSLGTDAETTRYFWRAQDIGFDADGRDVQLEIRMAAQLHRDNGFESAPAIGSAQAIHDWVTIRLSQKFLFQVSLMMLGLFSLVVWLYRPRDPSFVYFAGCCFCLMPTSMMLGFDNILLMILPGLGFWPMLAIVYMTGAAALFLVNIYVNTLYPDEAFPAVYRLIFWGIAAFSAVQAGALAIGTYPASRVNVFFVGVMAVTFIYQILVIARAVRAGRDGALPFLIGMSVMFLSLMIVGSIAAGILPRNLFSNVGIGPFGVVVMLFSHIVVLAERWSRAIVSSEAMTDDLRQLLEVNSSITSEIELEALLTRIVEVNSKMLRAERSSLLLYDESSRELWALVAEGVGKKVIRFPAGTGIAGRVFASGEPALVPDAYADPDFNRGIDEATGFHTHAIVAMPIATREGRRIGVLQALNRIGGGGFDALDLDRMRAFAAQAAIALDNATLFSEVIASRNYNESILASMSSGVVTLDPQLRIAKFNAAACRILKTEEGRLDGLDAREALSVANAGLVAELDAVSASGEPKLLLDADLVTYGGNTISANISIVPLLSEGEDVGLLILFEDISEGKRLAGAMRRFMPQQVVEQVLGREDDLMFGTACRASVLFADIRNFTSMTEKLTPRETVDMLNEVFTELFEAVASTHGILDKYIGDAVMAVYGVPFAGERDARNAVDAGVAMQRMIDEISAKRRADGRTMLNLGVGIATGDVVAGTVGSPKRMDYTVIGDSVNLASRLQELTKLYRCGILVDAETAREVRGSHALREIDTVQVRGREAMEPLFEVIVPRHGLEGEKLIAVLDLYQTGRARLARGDWEGAIEAFDGVLAENPDDGPAHFMRERALAGSKA